MGNTQAASSQAPPGPSNCLDHVGECAVDAAELHWMTHGTECVRHGNYTAADFDTRKRLLVAATSTSEIHVFGQPGVERVLVCEGVEDVIVFLHVLSCRSLVLLVTYDSHIITFDLNAGKVVKRVPLESVCPDPSRISCSTPCPLYMYRFLLLGTEAGRVLTYDTVKHTLSSVSVPCCSGSDHLTEVVAVQCNPTPGKEHLVLVAYENGVIVVYDLHTQQPHWKAVRELEEAKRGVRCAVWHESGDYVATGHEDGHVCVWQVFPKCSTPLLFDFAVSSVSGECLPVYSIQWLSGVHHPDLKLSSDASECAMGVLVVCGGTLVGDEGRQQEGVTLFSLRDGQWQEASSFAQLKNGRITTFVVAPPPPAAPTLEEQKEEERNACPYVVLLASFQSAPSNTNVSRLVVCHPDLPPRGVSVSPSTWRMNAAGDVTCMQLYSEGDSTHFLEFFADLRQFSPALPCKSELLRRDAWPLTGGDADASLKQCAAMMVTAHESDACRLRVWDYSFGAEVTVLWEVQLHELLEKFNVPHTSQLSVSCIDVCPITRKLAIGCDSGDVFVLGVYDKEYEGEQSQRQLEWRVDFSSPMHVSRVTLVKLHHPSSRLLAGDADGVVSLTDSTEWECVAYESLCDTTPPSSSSGTEHAVAAVGDVVFMQHGAREAWMACVRLTNERLCFLRTVPTDSPSLLLSSTAPAPSQPPPLPALDFSFMCLVGSDGTVASTREVSDPSSPSPTPAVKTEEQLDNILQSSLEQRDTENQSDLLQAYQQQAGVGASRQEDGRLLLVCTSNRVLLLSLQPHVSVLHQVRLEQTIIAACVVSCANPEGNDGNALCVVQSNGVGLMLTLNRLRTTYSFRVARPASLARIRLTRDGLCAVLYTSSTHTRGHAKQSLVVASVLTSFQPFTPCNALYAAVNPSTVWQASTQLPPASLSPSPKRKSKSNSKSFFGSLFGSQKSVAVPRLVDILDPHVESSDEWTAHGRQQQQREQQPRTPPTSASKRESSAAHEAVSRARNQARLNIEKASQVEDKSQVMANKAQSFAEQMREIRKKQERSYNRWGF